MDRGAWQATVHRISKSWTPLKRLSIYATTSEVYNTRQTSGTDHSLHCVRQQLQECTQYRKSGNDCPSSGADSLQETSADEWIRKLWYIYTMEYYSVIKNNLFESVLMRWMKLEPIIQSEVSQKDKDQYSILTHIHGIQKDGNDNPMCKIEKETQMYRTDFWTLWEKVRVGCFERTAQHVYYLG